MHEFDLWTSPPSCDDENRPTGVGNALTVMTEMKASTLITTAGRSASKVSSRAITATGKVDLANLHAQSRREQDRVFAEFDGEVADVILHELADRMPNMAARNGIRSWQKIAGVSAAAVLAVAALLAPLLVLLVLLGVTSVIALSTVVVSIVGLRQAKVPRVAPELADEQLPIYTVLVPAYREEEVIGEMVTCLTKLDYPVDRLDVIFLVESTDLATQQAIAAASPPAYMRVLQVPPGPPRTKPRSCNAGLLVAKGELLVIFDAEDRPEPQQLRRAAEVFAAQPANVACVQAELRTSNKQAHPIANCFGVEYALRFRSTVPGLAALGVPFPLGGTSNHFRTQVLREVGGWDAWNVSEDADLGMRLHSLGYRAQVVNSVTSGDAPDRLWDWVSQRTRWHKGFLLTALVHTRSPLKTIRQFGPRGLFGLMVIVFGNPLQFLAQPIILALGLAGLLGYHGMADTFQLDAGVLAVVQLAPMLMWMFVAYLSCDKPGLGDLRAVSALPLYWMAHWVAAWRGLYQLVAAPFLWEKTTHRAHPAAQPTSGHLSAVPCLNMLDLLVEQAA
ncbi:MAG: glycosyltransferase [Mycobacteriaceae bacterium]|nr:glycosyltransferase [Mycobacteriaceae bacterium]